MCRRMSRWSMAVRHGGGTRPASPAPRGHSTIGPSTPRLTPRSRRAPAAGLRNIYLIAPTTPEDRIELIVKRARGFIYYVSREGVTGMQSKISDTIGDMTRKIRAHTQLPIAVGFGISNPEQARIVAQFAEAIVVGSAIVNQVDSGTVGRLRSASDRVSSRYIWLPGGSRAGKAGRSWIRGDARTIRAKSSPTGPLTCGFVRLEADLGPNTSGGWPNGHPRLVDSAQAVPRQRLDQGPLTRTRASSADAWSAPAWSVMALGISRMPGSRRDVSAGLG